MPGRGVSPGTAGLHGPCWPGTPANGPYRTWAGYSTGVPGRPTCPQPIWRCILPPSRHPFSCDREARLCGPETKHRQRRITPSRDHAPLHEKMRRRPPVHPQRASTLRPSLSSELALPHRPQPSSQEWQASKSMWAAIASYLPQRTDNDIKNYWNTHLKKKVKRLQQQQSQPDHHHSFQTTTTSSSNAAAVAATSPNYYNPSSSSSNSNCSTHLHNNHNLESMQSMATAPSNEATTIPKLFQFQTWMKPSPATTSSAAAAAAGSCYEQAMAMQELQEEQEPAAAAAMVSSSINGCKDHMCAVISDDKSSSSEMMAAAAMGGHGEAATTTFSLLENWLLDDMPGQAAMSTAMDGFLEISAGYCCADPIMF